jgi:hypothetical protein
LVVSHQNIGDNKIREDNKNYEKKLRIELESRDERKRISLLIPSSISM